MNRREFVAAASSSGLAAILPASMKATSTPPTRRKGRPNILFIWSDQQSAATMSCAGNPWVETPAIDALAREGVSFERTYCNNPICVPSRTNWLTGRMSHESGIFYNTERGTVHGVPLSRSLRDVGYDCGYFGKWHIPHPASDRDWHGFETIDYYQAPGGDLDVVPGCEDFLRRERDQPFFLVASFVNPHDACEWARVLAGLEKHLPNGDIPPPPSPEHCPPLPPNFAIPAGEPAVIRQLQAAATRTYPTAGWTEASWRQYLWGYYRLTHRVDAQIGAILRLLRESENDDNTVIVFSSDHGDGAAAHHWNQKTLFYEECARVPFIVRPPRGFANQPGHRDASNLVSFNLDFFPTVYDYAGMPPPENVEGRSVRGLVEGRSEASGHPFLIAQNDLAPRYGESGGVFGRMLRTSRYKYVRYSAGADPEQLFDLEADPGEMNDLTLDAASTKILSDHRWQLDDWMRQHDDPLLSLPPEASSAVPT